jgi:CRISPR/Cas system CMR-associated protein Cmr5 small subunit
LNTLANHGYLPRNGRDITDQDIRDTMKKVYGVSESVSNFLIDQVKDIKNKNGNLDLNALRKHNFIGTDE